MDDTRGEEYAARLQSRGGVWWKRVLDVQAPYRHNLRRQDLGRTLDVGCGIGRNLHNLPPGSLGVDHNQTSVEVARSRGLDALSSQEWATSDRRRPESFDALLLAHVVEHMDESDAVGLLEGYLPYLRRGGRVMLVCPQERGYTTDPTHVRFTDDAALRALAVRVGLEPVRSWSFPFPRPVGRVFAYNEFCVLARKP